MSNLSLKITRNNLYHHNGKKSQKWISEVINNEFDSDQCQLPRVLMFDPPTQYPNDCTHPTCSTCNETCVPSWSQFSIRQVIDTEPSIIIQPTYVCPNNKRHSQGNKCHINPCAEIYYEDVNYLPNHIKNEYPVSVTFQ